MNDIQVADGIIGSKYPPFIVVEMSGNHNQSLDRALQIVEAAAAAGAHAIKLQTYTADTMTLDVDRPEFYVDGSQKLWQGMNLYKLYKEAYTPWEWHEKIFTRARQLGLIVFSTPFDATSVDFLESLHVPCYKIASFENTDLPLIKRIAAIGKPMIISTGMASVAEIDETVRTAREAGCNKLVLLKCTSTYPANPESTNLLTIPHMKELFDCHVGLSDHTMGIGAAVASVALGATLIEKHFTLSRSDGGVDASFSLEPDELKALVVESKRAWEALGQVSYGPTDKEKDSLKYRRSIFVIEDIKAGQVFNEKNIGVLRPGYGLAPKYYDYLLGRTARCNFTKGTPIKWDDIL